MTKSINPDEKQTALLGGRLKRQGKGPGVPMKVQIISDEGSATTGATAASSPQHPREREVTPSENSITNRSHKYERK